MVVKGRDEKIFLRKPLILAKLKISQKLICQILFRIMSFRFTIPSRAPSE